LGPDSLTQDKRPVAPPHETSGSSIAHRVDHDLGVVFVTLSGDVTMQTLRAAYLALRADAKFSTGLDILIECRVLTTMPTNDEIRTIALASIMHRADSRHGRVAIVGTTARSYEAASVFELFCEPAPDRLAIFTDRVQARHWLGIDDVI